MKDSNEDLITTEEMIGKFLRYGVILSIIIIGFGQVLLFVDHSASELSLLQGNSIDSINSLRLLPISPQEFFQGLVKLDPTSFICLGVVTLIFLPIFRVILTLILFIKEKDLIFILLTSAVLVILCLGPILKMTH